MLFNFGYESAFLLFFFVQGIVFSGLLLRNGWVENRNSSYWLSAFIFLCCLYICPWMFGHAGWYANDGYREFLFFVPFQQFFLLGPVMYCYTRSLLYPDFQIRGKDWLHFVPGGLYLLYTFFIFVADKFILPEYYFYADGRDRDLDTWYQISGLCSLIAYVVWSIRIYNIYRRRIFAELSYAESVVYDWIKKYLFALLLILVLRTLFLVLYPSFGSFGQKWWYYIFFSVLFYYIAIMGYTHAVKTASTIRLNMSLKTPVSEEDEQEEQESLEAPTSEIADLEEWKTKILTVVEKREMYRNPTLTLGDVANDLSTTTKQVSGVINRGFEMNFNDFVNYYRVESVKNALANGRQRELTLLGIALESGFNSKSTFNRVFKQHTGKTPGQYLKT